MKVEHSHRDDWWLMGGLVRLGAGAQPGPTHVFPLYYHDPASRTRLTPLFCRWEDDAVTSVIPPLLSGYSRDERGMSLTALLGVFHNRWDKDPAADNGHLLPLYYYEGKQKFLTPLFGWDRDEQDGYLYPLTPLAGLRRGDYGGGWLFPLFSRRRHKETGNVRGTFLWGGYWRDGQGRHSRAGLFPVFNYRNRGDLALADEPEAPVGTYGRTFRSLPFAWYRNELQLRPAPAGEEGAGTDRVRTRTRSHGCFPLWNYRRVETAAQGREDVDGSLLLALYDYRRRRRPDDDSATNEDGRYVRSRVLWRLWHYERAGDEVSVDIFPGMTYDRYGDSFKKVSFLWRLFRYEREQQERKLDLLFLPVMR
jgi:hypothetical protein